MLRNTRLKDRTIAREAQLERGTLLRTGSDCAKKRLSGQERRKFRD